jgi:hypothetical protein
MAANLGGICAVGNNGLETMEKINCFPNPCKRSFQLHLDGQAIHKKVFLYNAQGQLCRNWGAETTVYQVDGLASGIYWLRLEDHPNVQVLFIEK